MTTTPNGRDARSPTQIPKSGWIEILKRVKSEIAVDHVSVVAAGVAFFGLLAIFPAVTALVSIAGLMLDPADIAGQIEGVVGVLPANAAQIVENQLAKVTGGEESATGLAAAFGILLAIYGAMKGMKTLMEGMNIAYDETEDRDFVLLNVVALGLTLFLIFGLLAAFAVILLLPAVTAFVGLPSGVESAIAILKWPLLALLTVLGLAVLYRFGPSRAAPKWSWVSPGAVVATVLWLLGTVAFSIYAQNFGSYNETYGTLGGVIILLTWLWLSAFIVLAGAELNSEMEFQTEHDTTTGPPLPRGARGAVKADNLPDDRIAQGRAGPDGPDAPPVRPTRTAGNIVAAVGVALLLDAIRKPRDRDT